MRLRSQSSQGERQLRLQFTRLPIQWIIRPDADAEKMFGFSPLVIWSDRRICQVTLCLIIIVTLSRTFRSSSKPRSQFRVLALSWTPGQLRHLICGSNLFILPIQVFYWPFWRTATTVQLPAGHNGQTDKKGLFDDPEVGCG